MDLRYTYNLKGRYAAQQGEPREANPYVQPFARREWFDGYDQKLKALEEAAATKRKV